MAAVVVRESGRPTGSIPAAPRPALRTAHGISATFIAVFALIHLGNHLTGLLGASAHLQVMHALRSIYRSAFVEPALLACIAFQMVSGATLLWRATTATTSLKSSLQLASGAYMLCFFASHLSAVFRARHLRGIDTDWHWLTASPLLTDAWSARLVPYYWLAVMAIGIHAASGLRYVLLAHGVRDSRADRAFAAISMLSVLVATAIMIGMVSASHSR
jgi:succinate dehydrogenase/fumarate reductase cytochrome b subunit